MFDVATIPGPRPMSEMNTTPLIDVMLVLLIMFLIAIPVATHKVPIDLPAQDGPPGPPPPGHDLELLPGGALRWDGAAIGQAALPARLAALASDPANPVLRLRIDGDARYDHADQLLATIARANVSRVGFVGNQGFADSF